MSSMQPYMANCIRGILNMSSFSAFVELSYISFDTFLNFFSSKSSLTNDFTTLIPLRFSCTTRLRESYILNTFSKTGWAFFIMKNIPTPSIGIAERNTRASLWFTLNAIIRANTSITGQRTATLTIIW